jgi:hypothetical protein
MATSVYWTLYKTFNDPPGQQDLKCIKCRYATGAASTLVGLLGVYGVSRTMMANVYKGMGFVFLSAIGFGTAAVSFKMASQDRQWNERKIRETVEKLSLERKDYREKNQMVSH